MKNPYLIPVAAFALLFTPGCDRKSSETAKHLQELQRKASEAEDKQKELERQLEEQKVAAERDAIERDRLQIEKDRAELEREQGDAAAAKAEEIRKREEALAKREGKLEQVQADLEEKQADLSNRGAQLNDRERDLAGREALPFQDEEETVPVGDYGMFYDSLSSYGSWFETPDYGYVWQPVVVSDSNWRPYSRGRWVCTDRGWTWVSDEPFGWATYHYGRWALVRGRGWVWVPGTEWAPCWVSWRENRSHIGWAPLPPETMAYRNHRWDSSVDVQFGIGAAWFTFVEYRYFGSPLYQHCLPISQNSGCYGSTTNITYIHFENRQVICGGPRYRDACDRFGKPIPFCRLEIDRHPRPGGHVIGIRPQIKGDRLLVSAPNMDADWNGSLKPNRIKGRMDAMVVERNEPLRPEIADRYKKNREENQRIADRSIQQLGGAENFRQRRVEQLDENRRQVVSENRTPGKGRDGAKTENVPQPADVRPQVPERVDRPNTGTAEQIRNEEPIGQRPETPDQKDPRRPGIGTPGSYPREGLRPQQRPAVQNPAAEVAEETPRTQPREPKEQVKRPVEQPRVDPQEETNQRQRQAERMREDQQKQAADQQQQRETARQRQQEQARQQQEQAREEQQRQRQAEQAREAQKQAMEQQREQARQRQQAQEEARQQREEQSRQEQAQQQREMERQQERARQQQQEENQRQEQARQERQEENRRQQEQARQQEQENQRQRQQQEESRQKQEKDQDEQRRRNR